jgi:SAM-dependent methyltransferase
MSRRERMYRDMAAYYDSFYAAKDYRGETKRLRAIARREVGLRARTLLDVGCGTGRHLEHLIPYFECMGVDRNPAVLRIARRRLVGSGVTLRVADMGKLSLGRRFDVVLCLFGTIAYARTAPNLCRVIRRLAAHVAGEGILIVEAFVERDQYQPGFQHLTTYESGTTKIARMGTTQRTRGSRTAARIEYHTVIGENGDIRYERDEHAVGLFSADDMTVAFDSAGMSLRRLSDGLGTRPARALYVGRPIA